MKSNGGDITMIPQNQQGENWLKWRKIGSSDSPILLEVSPYMTPLELYEERMGLREPRFNAAMQKGKEKEDHIRSLMEKELGTVLMPVCIESKEHPYLTASLDGIDPNGEIICELKYNNKQVHEDVRQGKIPYHHIVQMIHQMLVFGNYNATIEYGSWNQDFIRRRVCLSVIPWVDIKKNIISRGSEFWECLQTQTPPKAMDRDLIMIDDFRANEIINELTIIKDDRKGYSIKDKLAKEREDKLKAELAEITKGKNAKIGDRKFEKVTRKGAVQYDEIEALKDVDLNLYRKEPITYWTLT